MRSVFLSCLLLIIGLASANADFLAYADFKGIKIPLPESLDVIAERTPKDLMNITYGEYSGPRTRIGVLPVENSSTAGSFSVSFGNGNQASNYSVNNYNQVPVNGIDAMITDILNNTGRFRIVEREVLGDLLNEQDLGTSGRLSKPSAAKTGKVLGAKTFIKAVVTAYEPDFKGSSIGVGALTGGALGGLKIGGTKSMVQMAFRLVDAETSEVIFSKQVKVIVGKKSIGFGGGAWGGGGVAGGAFSSFAKAPIGQAVISAVNVGVYELVKQIGLQAASGQVIQVTPTGMVAFNLGSSVVKVGDTFEALSKGEEFIDPETGLSLGAMEETLGTLNVVKVQEKFSFAKAADFDASLLKRGDKVLGTAPTGELEFADTWSPKKFLKGLKGKK